MFQLSYSTPQKEQLTLKVKQFPKTTGTFKDADGNLYNCYGYGTRDGQYWAWLCPQQHMHPYYTDTSSSQSFGLIQQSWKSYKLELVED